MLEFVILKDCVLYIYLYIFSEPKEAEKLLTNGNKSIKVKLTTKNRGACFLDEPPRINARRHSEFPAATSSSDNHTDTRPINGKCNWRKQKLTFKVVDNIQNTKLEKTPEILKPCWLQRKSLNKKSVRFELPEITNTDVMPQKIKELPPPPQEKETHASFDLITSILSWKPDWIKTVNPEIDFENTQETLNFFQTSCQYKK